MDVASDHWGSSPLHTKYEVALDRSFDSEPSPNNKDYVTTLIYRQWAQEVRNPLDLP